MKSMERYLKSQTISYRITSGLNWKIEFENVMFWRDRVGT